jgi:hypothetical protein
MHPKPRVSDYVSTLQRHMLQASQPVEQRRRSQRLTTHEMQHSRHLAIVSTLREVS